MAVVEFIEKLLSILKDQPSTVRWISNGKQFEIIDQKDFTERVLPKYFRHGKFESFIRQLNMYGFHKVNRRKNSNIFQHQHFIQNQEQQYKLIKRTKKTKVEMKNKIKRASDLQIDTNLLSQRAPKMAELLNKLIQFNTKNQFDYRKLKSKLELLSRQVSAKKQRSIRPIIKSIKQKIVMLDQIQRNMSTLQWSALTNYQVESPTKSHNQQTGEQFESKKKIMSAPAFGFKSKQQRNNNVPQLNSLNFFSIKSVSHFLEIQD